MERSFLIVEDDVAMRALVARLIRRRFPAARVLEAADAEQALRLLDGNGEGVTVVTDFDLGNGMDGSRLLSVVRTRHPGARRVLLTGAPHDQVDADVVLAKAVRFPGLLESL